MVRERSQITPAHLSEIILIIVYGVASGVERGEGRWVQKFSELIFAAYFLNHKSVGIVLI